MTERLITNARLEATCFTPGQLLHEEDGVPEVAGTDIRDIVQCWEEYCEEDKIPADLDTIANVFLGRFIPPITNNDWIIAYHVNADVYPASQYLYVITLNRFKRPKYIDVDCYKIPMAFYLRQIKDWKLICTPENKVEIPNIKCPLSTKPMNQYLIYRKEN